MLKQGLLEGVTIAYAGEDAALAEAAALGARTVALGEPDDEMTVDPVPDVLVCATDDLDAAFISTRAVANAWIAGERPGKVVLVAPRNDAPLRAALENLSRTLSIEWARYGITPTAILPGAGSSDAEVAQLVAFLASPAGDYYSGCTFTLR